MNFFVTLAQLPDPDPAAPPIEGLTSVLAWAKWLGLFVCILGLIAGGATMAVSASRGDGLTMGKQIAFPILGAIIVGGAVALIGFFTT